MLKKIFTKSSSQQSAHKKSKPSLTSVKDGIIEHQAEIGAERELYQYERPTQEFGLAGLVKDHKPGTRFLYAALTGKEEEDVPSRMRRLAGFKPRLNKQAFTIDQLPTIKLYRETETFPLSKILSAKGVGSYIRISDAICLYGAIVSPDCCFTKAKIGIIDNRLLDGKLVKSFVATTNIPSIGNLKLPYCFPREDANRISLVISRERAFIEEGLQWGAIQLQMVIESYEFPVQFENTEVNAMNKLPGTLLEDRVTDPDHIDISITNNTRGPLAELYLQGDIADENEPIENKLQKVKYAETSMSRKPKGKVLSQNTSDWKFLEEKRVGMVSEELQSIEPSEPSIQNAEIRPPTPPKSAMKHSGKSVNEIIEEQTKRKVEFQNDTSRMTPWN